MKVRVKKLVENAVIPAYAKAGDAGLDLTAVSKEYDSDGNVVYDTGLAFEIPEGYVGLLFPRSSISKKDLTLSNSVGVIDSGYRGSVIFKMKQSKTYESRNKMRVLVDDYEVGERIGQLLIMPYPQIQLIESDTLSETERGTGGYGSTNEPTKYKQTELPY